MNKLQALKCIEVTSQRQADNGTICYHDPMTGADYTSHENGYIRRTYKTKSWRTGLPLTTTYQLNPQKTTEWGGVVRVMIPTQQARLGKLAKAVANWRQTLKKQNYNPVYNH